MITIDNQAELDQLVENWTDSPSKTRETFIAFLEYLGKKEKVVLSFVARPGITYSLRAKHADQKNKDLYAMVDVIDDDPTERWLSVCFYGDFITDPDENGDFVPEGLLGEDACCFDIDEADDELVAYVRNRLEEAYGNAAKIG